MAFEKTNEYTGVEYQCTCDYSYTCEQCSAIRTEFYRRELIKSREDWIIDAVQRLAQKLGLDLPPPPKDQNPY